MRRKHIGHVHSGHPRINQHRGPGWPTATSGPGMTSLKTTATMGQDSNDSTGEPSDYGGRPFYPVHINNGYLTKSPHRGIPTTDVDHSTREYQYPIDVGFRHVQINNGLFKRRAAGLRGPLNFVDWLYASYPIIPGQNRDNYGGFHKRGIDPQSYAQLWANGPGSQPVNPGGPGKIAAPYFYNPGTT